MSEDAPERSPRARLVEALSVARNLKIGLAVGVAFAALVYAVRVLELLGPTTDSRGGPVLFLALAFVLAVTLGALVATALTLVRAIRLAREETREPAESDTFRD